MIIIVCVCGLGLGVGCWVWMGYRMYHTIPVGCVWVMYDTVIKFWGLYLVFCVLFCIVLHCRWGRGCYCADVKAGLDRGMEGKGWEPGEDYGTVLYLIWMDR